MTKIEKWLIKRWTKAGYLYRPMEGGSNFPAGPIQIGSSYLYETALLPLPQTTTKAIFTLAGLRYLNGPASVFIDGLWGVVTTTVGAVANATKLQFVATDNT